MSRIEAERVQAVLEPLREALPRLTQALIARAEAGNVPALRTCGDWLGLTRKGGPSVQVAVDAGGHAAPEDDDDIEELLRERAGLAEIVNKYVLTPQQENSGNASAS